MNDVIINKLRVFICSQFLNDPDYSLEDSEALITGGLIDSFSLAQIGVFIENAFGIYIPDTDLTVDNMDTLSQIAACVENRQYD
jgi:acyl carrier protein